MANVVNDLKTIIHSISINSISLPDAKSWQDQHDRIRAVFKFVDELELEEDDLK